MVDDGRVRESIGHKAAPASVPGARCWLILLLVAIAARAVTFGNPILHTDEEFYLVFARAMVHGAVPYVDIWDRKPIGLFLVYLLPALFRPMVGVVAVQALALAAVVGTAGLIARVAARVGWRRGAVAAGAVYILWLDLADGQGGQAPVFYNLLVIGAVALVASPTVARRHGLAAMALIGAALQIKYSVVFEGIAIGLWLLWCDRRGATIAGRIGYAATLCAVAALPTLAAWAVLQAIGAGPAFVYANFVSILARHPDSPAEQLLNIENAAGILITLLILTFATWREAMVPWTTAEGRVQRFLFAWLAAALFGFLIFGSWFNHYTLPVMVPASVCAAGILGDRRYGRTTALLVLVLGFVAGQLILRSEQQARGTRAEFEALVRAIGPGPGTLYVHSGTAMLYAVTGRTALSPYVLPSHLHLAREHGAIGVDQAAEIRRIFARRPDVVVVQSPIWDETPALTATVAALLEHNGYVRQADLPLGRRTSTVWRLPTSRVSRQAGR